MPQNCAGGSVVLRPNVMFNAVKVFSATMFKDRDQLGEQVTSWMAANPRHEITEIRVTQSSDESFHCITMTVFYRAASVGLA